jgi:hypothetical protein
MYNDDVIVCKYEPKKKKLTITKDIENYPLTELIISDSIYPDDPLHPAVYLTNILDSVTIIEDEDYIVD